MRRLRPGDKVWCGPAEGLVLIAEGDLAFVELGDRVCRFELQDGKYQRDWYQPANGVTGHDELDDVPES